jgi:hypothetical protein
MDIVKGFQIDEPDLFINWNIDRNGLLDVFKNYNLRKVTTDVYTSKCKCMGVLECHIGFHFNKDGNNLSRVQFFRQDYKGSLEESFNDFQTHLEKNFGPPEGIIEDNNKFPRYSWGFGNILIFHYVQDRFGPEENVFITKSEK